VNVPATFRAEILNEFSFPGFTLLPLAVQPRTVKQVLAPRGRHADIFPFSSCLFLPKSAPQGTVACPPQAVDDCATAPASPATLIVIFLRALPARTRHNIAPWKLTVARPVSPRRPADFGTSLLPSCILAHNVDRSMTCVLSYPLNRETASHQHPCFVPPLAGDLIVRLRMG